MFLFSLNYYQNCLIIDDISNQANSLLVNLKEIIDKLQAKNTSFQSQVKQLKSENKQLIIANKNLCNEVNCLKKG